MSRISVALIFVLLLASPANAFGENTGTFEDLEFVSQTSVAAPGQPLVALCYTTTDIRLFGVTLLSNISGYALATANCAGEITQRMSADDIRAAQSAGTIGAEFPAIARNDLQRNLTNYGLWAAIILGLVAVIIRRVKSLLGYDLRGPMRRKTTQRIIKALCHAGQCDGLIDSNDIALIRRTAARLTRRAIRIADVVKVADKVKGQPTPQEFIDLGNGLRDSEKDVLMQAVFYLVLHNGRLLPAEYDFLTGLAHGIGMPGEDFRRVMNIALGDLDLYPVN